MITTRRNDLLKICCPPERSRSGNNYSSPCTNAALAMYPLPFPPLPSPPFPSPKTSRQSGRGKRWRGGKVVVVVVIGRGKGGGGAGAGTPIVEGTERSIADDNAATSPYCFELFWHSSYCINKNDESSIAFFCYLLLVTRSTERTPSCYPRRRPCTTKLISTTSRGQRYVVFLVQSFLFPTSDEVIRGAQKCHICFDGQA